MDGNAAQIEAITAEAQCRHLSAHIICDFIHVLEYLWKAAWSFFHPGDPTPKTGWRRSRRVGQLRRRVG